MVVAHNRRCGVSDVLVEIVSRLVGGVKLPASTLLYLLIDLFEFGCQAIFVKLRLVSLLRGASAFSTFLTFLCLCFRVSQRDKIFLFLKAVLVLFFIYLYRVPYSPRLLTDGLTNIRTVIVKLKVDRLVVGPRIRTCLSFLDHVILNLWHLLSLCQRSKPRAALRLELLGTSCKSCHLVKTLWFPFPDNCPCYHLHDLAWISSLCLPMLNVCSDLRCNPW
jgi:hypothetical protein